MSEIRLPGQPVAVSLSGAGEDLVRQALPLVFRVQSVERHPLPAGGVRNVASLFNEAAALKVNWLSRVADPRVAADCLVSIRWQGNAVSIGGHVRIGRLVALERPMAGLNLFDTVPTRWVRERELVQRGKALWESLPLAFRDLFNAMFWNGGRFRRYLVGPSSLENHHNGLNGNFRHSLEVAEQALALARDHDLVSLPVMILAGLIHDAGKADEYRYDHARRCFAMAPEATLVGHRDRLQHWLAAARERCGEGVPQRQYLALVHALTATYGAPPHLGLREPLSLEAMLLSMADRASGRTELIGRLASPGGGFGRYHRHLRGRPFVAAAWDA